MDSLTHFLSDWNALSLANEGLRSLYGDGMDDSFRKMLSVGRKEGRKLRRDMGLLTVSPHSFIHIFNVNLNGLPFLFDKAAEEEEANANSVSVR
jgi:hypothetical protein